MASQADASQQAAARLRNKQSAYVLGDLRMWKPDCPWPAAIGRTSIEELHEWSREDCKGILDRVDAVNLYNLLHPPQAQQAQVPEHESPPAKARKFAPREFQFVERQDSDFLRQTNIGDWALHSSSVVHVPKDVRRICGEAGGNQKLFFCREFCVEFYKLMMANLSPAPSSAAAAPPQSIIQPLILLGCPGSGKTLITWAYSLYASLRLGLSVLFVLADFGILYFNSRTSKIEQLQELTTPSNRAIEVTPDLFRILIRERTVSAVDVLFIDGIQKANVDYWVRACCQSEISKLLVLSSSVGAFAGNQTQQDFLVKYLYQPSWTFEEYVAACQVPRIRDLFLSNCQPSEPEENLENVEEGPQEHLKDMFQDMLHDKYHLAGGCARWMLDTPADVVRRSILEKLNQVTDAQIILQNLGGIQGDGIVHGLFQKFWAPEESVQRLLLVSRFAADSLVVKFENLDDLMTIANRLWTTACTLGNGALQGWAFEFRLYALICRRRALTFLVRLPGQQFDQVFVPTKVVVFPNEITSVSLKNLTDLDKASGFWLKPQKSNHGCYDFAFCRIITIVDGTKQVELWSVQATVSEHHSLKMTYLRKLLHWASSLGVLLSLRHIGCVPSQHFTSFHFDAPQGSIAEFVSHGLDYQVGVAMSPEL